MAKLEYTLEASSYMPYIENWILDNNLVVGIYFESFCQVTISNSTGDIADQIYEKILKLEKFKDLKLNAISCYFIQIDEILIKDFINEIEKIDTSSLKKGKSY